MLTTRPEIRRTFGAVASPHWLASSAGMGVAEPTVDKMGEARGHTVHLDIVDKDGNKISATPRAQMFCSADCNARRIHAACRAMP